MFSKSPASLACAMVIALFTPVAAHAADAAVPNIAVMSLIGDNITTEAFARTTGSKVEGNRKVLMPIENPVFDQEAIQAANSALKLQRPGVQTVLMITPDKGLYQAQNAMFESADANKDNRDYLKSLLKNRGVTQLVLITKHRADAEFKVDNGHVGSGKIEGLGFYMDNEARLRSSRTLASGTGFVAAYVYAKVRLVDAETLTVLKEVNVRESDLNPNFNVTSVQLLAWNAITSQQKITRLSEVLADSMKEAIPKLMAP